LASGSDPYGFGLFHESAAVEYLADFGVAFLALHRADSLTQAVMG
jgi:hypothetical protein